MTFNTISIFNALSKWDKPDIEVWILRKNGQRIIMEQCDFLQKDIKILFGLLIFLKKSQNYQEDKIEIRTSLHETHYHTWADNYHGTTFFLPWFLKNDLIDYAYSFMSCLMNTISTDNIVTENQKVYMKTTIFWVSKKVFFSAVLPLILF